MRRCGVKGGLDGGEVTWRRNLGCDGRIEPLSVNRGGREVVCGFFSFLSFLYFHEQRERVSGRE